MTKLLLVRHGETEWNQTGRFQGQSDVSLNSAGVMQSQALAASIKGRNISAVYSSDLSRALMTARYIAAELGLNVHEDARFREINLGVWEGLRPFEIEEAEPGALDRRNANPCTVAPLGGETLVDVEKRVAPAVKEIIARHRGEEVIVVSHGITIRVIELSLTKGDLAEAVKSVPGNAELRSLECKDFG